MKPFLPTYSGLHPQSFYAVHLHDEILNIDTEKLTIELPSCKRFGTAKAEEIKAIAQNSFGIILEHNTIGILIEQHAEHIRFSEQQIAEIDSKIAELFSQFDTYITTQALDRH